MAPAFQEDKQMFDKLIESEPEGADFKNRRRYFMVSSVVVGVLFTTAVVISIYAADIGLGSTGFELTEIMAPPEMAAIEPETQQSRPATASQSQSQTAKRQVNMTRIDESPVVPTTTSVVANTQQTRPIGEFKFDTSDSNPVDPGGSGRDTTGPGSNNVGLSTTPRVIDSIKDPEQPPPPVVKIPVKKPPTQSLGVINGKASYLPKPAYSAAAIAMHAGGKVDVQVMIDESGKVISANAVSGHPLLRGAAEQAARNAKFTTTYLSNVPVKVTGVIVYNFTR